MPETIPAENLPTTLSMWINPIILAVAVFIIARVTRKIFGLKIERSWYTFFGYAFLVLFAMVFGFFALNEGIRNDLVEKKGWFYLFSLTFPILTFSLVMLSFSSKVKKHIQSSHTTPASAPR